MKKLVLLGFTVLSLMANAQQDPQYTMHVLNPLAINPAFAGSRGEQDATLVYRNQWMGLDKSPTTIAGNYQSRYNQGRLATGVSYFGDKNGLFTHSALTVSQAYHVKMTSWTLSLALSAGIEEMSANLSSINHTIAGEVDNAFASDIKKTYFNFGFGGFAYNERFWIGFSMPHLLKQDWGKQTNGEVQPAYQAAHSYLTAGGVVNVNPFVDVKPYALIKWAENVTPQLEMGSTFYYQKRWGAGVGCRGGDAGTFNAGAIVNDHLRIGYAYDRTVSGLSAFTRGGHEIMVRYHFGKGYKGLR